MARRSLRPNLNQIRAWVRQGRTDAWVAHQLDVSVRDIEQFKRQNDLMGEDEAAGGLQAGHFEDEIDLRAEDDALIAAELEAAEIEARREQERREAEESEEQERKERERAEARERGEEEPDEDADEDEDEDGARGGRLRRRRGGRGRRSPAGRSRTRNTGPLEGTFDHGEEGYGLWMDPAIVDNPIYAEHWAGHRPIEVVVEEDQIVIRRAGEGD